MTSEIIVGALALAGTLFGSLFGVLQANKLSNHRIAALEKKMDKHNNLVERLTKVEVGLEAVWRAVDGSGEK